MSFDKAYPNRKDWRRVYHGASSVDRSCRNHGSCPYCLRNRTVQDRKARAAARDQLRDLAFQDPTKE